MMSQNIEKRRSPKSKCLNLAIWVTIVVVTALIAAVTIWARHQPDLPSIWAPE
jgi:hypothetical protein